MKKLIKAATIFCVFMSMTSMAYATNVKYYVPLQVSLKNTEQAGIINGSVKFYFADQPHPRVLKNFGTYITHPFSNAAFAKSNGEACNRAFESGMKALQNRARLLGANGVINIVSYYAKKTMSSDTVYECHVGALAAGITLKGDFVTLQKSEHD